MNIPNDSFGSMRIRTKLRKQPQQPFGQGVQGQQPPQQPYRQNWFR